MRQNSISIRNLKSFTYQHVLERFVLSTPSPSLITFFFKIKFYYKNISFVFFHKLQRFIIHLFSIIKGILFVVQKDILSLVPNNLKQVSWWSFDTIFLYQDLTLGDLIWLSCLIYLVQIGTKLSEDSRKYGSENTCTSGSTLSRAALNHGRARAQMEKERGNLLKALGTQVWPRF